METSTSSVRIVEVNSIFLFVDDSNLVFTYFCPPPLTPIPSDLCPNLIDTREGSKEILPTYCSVTENVYQLNFTSVIHSYLLAQDLSKVKTIFNKMHALVTSFFLCYNFSSRNWRCSCCQKWERTFPLETKQ